MGTLRNAQRYELCVLARELCMLVYFYTVLEAPCTKKGYVTRYTVHICIEYMGARCGLVWMYLGVAGGTVEINCG